MDITVIEIAPPLTETSLYLSEFAETMKVKRELAAFILVKSAIRANESGKMAFGRDRATS